MKLALASMTALALIAARACEKVIVAPFRRRFRALAHEPAAAFRLPFRCLGLAYGGFSYTKQTSAVKLGPLELKVQEKETVNVPLFVSAGAIAIGVVLLVAVGRK